MDIVTSQDVYGEQSPLNVQLIGSVQATTASAPKMGLKTRQFTAAAIAYLSAYCCGVSLGWSSPGLHKLLQKDETPLKEVITDDQESWVGSLTALGASVGPFPAAYAANRIGRKSTLLGCMGAFLSAWFLLATTDSLLHVYAGRFVIGLGIGGVFTALTLYIGEIAEAVLGVYFYFYNHGYDVRVVSALPVVSLVFFMLSYCVGFGPLPWAVMNEIFTPAMKSSSFSFVVFYCWFLGFLLTKVFGDVVHLVQMSGAFWIFSACCVGMTAFVHFLLPETKGKSLSTIQKEMFGEE